MTVAQALHQPSAALNKQGGMELKPSLQKSTPFMHPLALWISAQPGEHIRHAPSSALESSTAVEQTLHASSGALESSTADDLIRHAPSGALEGVESQRCAVI
eukprot:600979-Pelagomonas_calceolata.AAC.2